MTDDREQLMHHRHPWSAFAPRTHEPSAALPWCPAFRRKAPLSALILPLLLTGSALASPQVPGAPQDHPVALVGANIHPVSGPPIENGEILFNQGKIVAIGKGMPLGEDVERIDVGGKHVYPGLIDASTDLGLVEIPSVRATVDNSETGSVNPNVKAQVAVNPDSELIPVTRSNGVLAVVTQPGGGLVSGTSALLLLDGWTWEDMTLKAPLGMHVSWPRSFAFFSRRQRQPQPDQADGPERAVRQLEQLFDEARAYRTARQSAGRPGIPPQAADPRLEALLPVLDGSIPLIVEADDVRQIQSAVAFAEKQAARLILLGGYDAPLCRELLKARDIPVIVGGVQRLPQRRGDDYDAPFTLPSRLHEAGIRFCISGANRDANVRNLPYHAATAAAYGLPEDVALKAVTQYAAEILGVADRMGTLEPGKDATLVVADGDILEIATHVEMAYIQGRKLDLSDRHKALYEKYKEKYRRLHQP